VQQYNCDMLNSPYHIRRCKLLPVFVIALCLGKTAWPQQSIATYPPLPAGINSIRVMDSKGRYVGRIPPQKRYWVSLDRIPAFLQQALLAVEDSRFYEHEGIDYRGIARAAVTDVLHGKLVQGGSTITQQLIKNKYLSSAKTIDRKLREAEMALEFEKRYTKRQILEMYFNEIYFGKGAYGIAQAARIFFDKSPEELTEGECILLAGVPKNPRRYNPFGKPADVVLRREHVLNRMLELNIINDKRKLALQKHGAGPRPLGEAPQYLAQLRTQLAARLGADVVEMGGIDVFAAMDLDLQKTAERVLKDGIKRLSPGLQGALICMDPVTGDVLAAVGDANGIKSSIDRAFVARRQTGSAIKPFIYAAALENGINAGSIWSDAPAAYDRGNGRRWKPRNYSDEHFGELSLRQALAHSSNIITVKVLETVGVPAFVDFAGRMGIPLHASNGLSLALGTEDVTLNDLVQAYTALPAGGIRAQARTVLRIHDLKHDIWTEIPPATSQVLSPAAAFITTQMLKDVLTYGTAKGLRGFGQAHPCAGKTGTTDDYLDAWFVGFTPNLVTGIWVGYDKPKPGGKGFTGGAVAAPIWESFMRKIVSARPAEDFAKPDTVMSITIDPATGLRAREECPQKQDEFYIPGTEPADLCPNHGGDPVPQAPAPEVPAPQEPAEPQPAAPASEELPQP
jgi:1A family penicillin-binding protein